MMWTFPSLLNGKVAKKIREISTYPIDVGIITTDKHVCKISVLQIHAHIYRVKESIGDITTIISSDQTQAMCFSF